MVYGIYRPWMRRNTTIINHYSYMMNTPNNCGYGTGGCGGGISNKALAWILGITGGVALAGGICGGVSQNRQARADAQEQKLLQQKQDAKNATAETLQQLKNTYGDEWNVMVQGEEFILQNKEDPSKVICGPTLKSIVNQIAEDSKATKTETDEGNTPLTEEENKELDELKEIVAEQGETIEALTAQLEATQNGNTPSDVGTGTLKPITGDTTLPGEYTWGKMGDTDDKYKDKTAEYIARDVLGENASDEDVTAMAEKITNMNPNAFGSDGKVTNPSRLNVPEIKTNATGTPTSTSTPQTENSTASNWKLMESPGMFSRDAWITAGDGNTYKLRCSNGDHLNHGKLTIEGDKIVLNEAYRNKDWANHPIKLVDRETENSVEFKLEATTGRFVLNGSNPAVYLEAYLNNPEKYTNTEKKTSNTQGEVAQANGTTSASGTGNSNVITGKVTYGKDDNDRRIASVTVTNSNGVSKTFTTLASDNRMVNIGKLNSLILKDPDFVGQRINLED